jgi:glycosyltransferase involved in cell wall biosynthesis
VERYLNCLASLPTGTPLSVAYCRSRQARQLVEELVERGCYDVIHTEFVHATPFIAGLDGRPKVYDAVDSLTLTYRRSLSAAHVPPHRRLVALFEWLKMRRFESRVLRHFDRVVVSSPADREALERAGGNGVTVVPNGVSVRYFAFREEPRDEETIVFLGKMSYYVNVASVLWFYREVFPLIRRQRPRVRLKIVGRDPTPRITALAADDAVEVTGTVPDVRSHLARATVSICPMITGAGIQNKVLEAMAVGTPTVATTIACQALTVESGHDVLIADSAEAFAAGVLELLDDEGLRRQLTSNARRYVEQHHTWEIVGRQLEEIYNDLLGQDAEN